MIGLDTNVLLRVFVEDHAEQVAAVRKLLKGAEASSFFISDIVLVELVWTLRRSFKATRARIVEAIEGLLASNVFVLEHRDDVSEATSLFESTRADFSDCLVAVRNRRLGAEATMSFDQDAIEASVFVPVPG